MSPPQPVKDRHKRYDAVIVLANLMDEQGKLNRDTRARVDTAIEALRNDEAPLLVGCGWAYRDDSSLAIADAICSYATEHHGIPVSALVAERSSRDTVGDAIFTKRNLAIPGQWTSILVVTSTYHVSRAKQVFSFVYGAQCSIDVRGAPSSDTEELRKSELRSLEAFRSTFHGLVAGDDEPIFERLRQQHPFYNGLIYAKL